MEENLKGLILDLRFNPGGLLNTTRDVAGLFLTEGIVASIRAPGLHTAQEIKIEPGMVRFGGPMVVLINEESASAAEILTSCLRDHRRCLIAGARSAGQGSVQNIHPCAGDELKLSVAVFVSPSGHVLQGWQQGEGGVVPDAKLVVALSRKDREELRERLRNSEILPRIDRPVPDPYADFRDVQLDTALAALRERVR
jgi:carboxyl-terminal processing protease